jgi:long-subunit fatty acid transport protein
MTKKLNQNIIKLSLTTALFAGTMLAIPAEEAKAVANQVFTSYAYTNPAELDYIENFKATFGSFLANANVKFNGSQTLNVNNPTARYATGKSTSDMTRFFYYGNASYRFESLKRLCMGINVSNPEAVYYKFKNGPAAGYDTELFGRVYTLKSSFQVTDKFTIGLGLSSLWVSKFKINSQIAPGQQLRNKGHGSTFGWEGGFIWKLLQGTHVGASYHSKLFVNSKGYSDFITPNSTRTTFSSMNVNLPDTFSVNWLQFFSKNWLINLSAKYMLWKKAFVDFTERNTPIGTLVFPLHFKNAWVGQFYTRWQFHDKFAALGFVEYDQNPLPKRFRPLNFAADKLWFFGVGLEYMPTKNLSTQIFYGYANSKPSFNNVNTMGNMKININLIDLRVTYKF